MQWLGVTLFIFLVACQPQVSPNIYPPPLPKIPAKTDYGKLRQLLPGARAILPAYDGEGFFVSIPPKEGPEVSSKMVYDDTVSKILEAIGGFNPKSKSELKRLGEQGISMPKASLEGFAKTTCKKPSTKKPLKARFGVVPSSITPTTKKILETRTREGEVPPDASIARRALPGPVATGICDVLVGGFEPSEQLNKRFLDSYGMTFVQYRADIERREIHFFFPQVHRRGPLEHHLIQGMPETVPIEHVGVLAARREGKAITSVVGRVITSEYNVTNIVKLTPRQAAELGPAALTKIRGISRLPKEKPPEHPDLLLLPYGEDKGRPELRYVYRMPVVAQFNRARGLFYLWLDAETGKILELQPLIHAVAAEGRTFHQSPDVPKTDVVSFEIDSPTIDSSGNRQFSLRLEGNLEIDGWEVTLPPSTNMASSDPVNFDQAPITDGIDLITTAVDPKIVACATGSNKSFQRIDLMATLSRYLGIASATGLLPRGDPTIAVPPVIVSFDSEIGCNSWGGLGGLTFGDCSGYSNHACADAKDEYLNFIHDHTLVAHELAHFILPHLFTARPADWCVAEAKGGPCPVPDAPGLFHDFADSWAHALENTNCVGGWVAKNQGGRNKSLNCAKHDEGGGLPRQAEVTVDHFPEHRHKYATGPYADMQIAAAALWAVREGIRSRDPSLDPNDSSSGAFQYLVRFARGLRMIGWNGLTPHTTGWFGLSSLTLAEWFGTAQTSNTDRDIFLGLLELELQLANQWAGDGFSDSGAHTTNKVTAGFAKAGIFLIPLVCIDGDATTKDTDWCPNGESGADAVIDVEGDYLKRDGSPPKFHVWTGPRYVFKDGKADEFPKVAPCNTEFQVEVSNDAKFTQNLTQSGFLKVRPDSNGLLQPCYDTWTIPPDKWSSLRAGDQIYYRVTTRDASGQNVRTSTTPGNGLFQVPPSYAIVNDTGRPPETRQ